jgi:hypothetical protein
MTNVCSAMSSEIIKSVVILTFSSNVRFLCYSREKGQPARFQAYRRAASHMPTGVVSATWGLSTRDRDK